MIRPDTSIPTETRNPKRWIGAVLFLLAALLITPPAEAKRKMVESLHGQVLVEGHAGYVVVTIDLDTAREPLDGYADRIFHLQHHGATELNFFGRAEIEVWKTAIAVFPVDHDQAIVFKAGWWQPEITTRKEISTIEGVALMARKGPNVEELTLPEAAAERPPGPLGFVLTGVEKAVGEHSISLSRNSY